MALKTIEQQFWNRIQKTDTCWIWIGPKKGKYGYVSPVKKFAHIFSYELHYGPMPIGKNLGRDCNNELCVNPKHLFINSTENQKRCPVCKEYKDRIEFAKDSSCKDGYCARCKVCIKQYQQDNRQKMIDNAINWNKAHPQVVRARVKIWKKNNPEKIKEDPIKQIKRTKRWQKANPDKVIAAIHRRRARELANGGEYTAEQWQALCAFYDNRCLCCKEQKKLTVDHVIPISKGGSNDISNIQPLCLVCNIKKNTKIIDYR